MPGQRGKQRGGGGGGDKVKQIKDLATLEQVVNDTMQNDNDVRSRAEIS